MKFSILINKNQNPKVKKFIPFEVLEKFMVNVMVKAGIPQEDSKIVADVLLQADKLGFDSHGVNRLKSIYLDRIKQGILNPITSYKIVREGPTTAVIDGQNGMGHVISFNAMKLAIEKAKKYGMGMITVRNSSHYGFAGYYPLMAVREDMIGITGTNARPSVAPTFGVENMSPFLFCLTVPLQLLKEERSNFMPGREKNYRKVG
jgi:LDH2 family malate/lactate/ureidoglycolate dehydrogenase